MTQRRSALRLLLISFASLAVTCKPSVVIAESLPTRISDADFWRLTEELSERGGYFRSDNLVSNEVLFQAVIPELVRRTKPGGAYLGVGPEQNFTYIAALKARIAFITDIRRGNLHTHLMYKALFELSSDRLEFVARLFTKSPAKGLGPSATPQEILDLYEKTPTRDESAYKDNLAEIRRVLVDKHGFPLSSDDLEGIDHVYGNFYKFGPAITYNSSSQSYGARGSSEPSYSHIMAQADSDGVGRGYLASEENFKFVKNLEERNLIIPVVGDFAGPKAIRAVGKYLKEHDTTVSAFYVSNVESYLSRLWNVFCRNVASLPMDAESTFIRSARPSSDRAFETSLGSMQSETKACSDPDRGI